jgi:quaternary ammonium compound-resistance protein SugE
VGFDRRAVDGVHSGGIVRHLLDRFWNHVESAQRTPTMRGDMAWLILFVAGLFEIGWAIGLKYTDGFTKLVPSVLTVVAMAVSVILLGVALKTLPVGTAYAVWTGVGAVGTAILGIYLFGDPATAARLASIGLIVAGIVGLKLVT